MNIFKRVSRAIRNHPRYDLTVHFRNGSTARVRCDFFAGASTNGVMDYAYFGAIAAADVLPLERLAPLTIEAHGLLAKVQYPYSIVTVTEN